MANTLTGLIPTLYAALDNVQRELVGLIPSATLDPQVARAAVGQTVSSPVAPPAAAADIVPGVTAPATGSQVIGKRDITISKARAVPILWNGEEVRGIESGSGINTIFRDQVSQALRTLVNEIEVDLMNEARVNASRAVGTPGTAPFGTAGDLSDIALPIQIIEDNGGAGLERSLVLSTAAMANIRGKQSVLFKVNEAGTDQLMRMGVLGMLQGSHVRQSAALKPVTKGTGAGFLVNNGAGYAVGDTAITVDTGTGTILAGDTITFAGDANKYVVTGALAANVVTIGAPGLRAAVADNVAITVGNSATPNLLFAKSALVLATRAPALPKDPNGRERDMAEDRMMIQDPLTGLAFELAVYTQYRQIHYELGIAWGQRAAKTENIATLLG